MIEFKPRTGPLICFGCAQYAKEFDTAATAVVEDGVWYSIGTCANERHIAIAVDWHQHCKVSDDPYLRPLPWVGS